MDFLLRPNPKIEKLISDPATIRQSVSLTGRVITAWSWKVLPSLLLIWSVRVRFISTASPVWFPGLFSLSVRLSLPLRQSSASLAMSILPDEMWSKILEMGTETSRLNYRDLCSIAITCRRFNRLSNDHALWSTLLALDFPRSLPSSSSSCSSLPQSPVIATKTVYKTRFERDRARRTSAWRRSILNVESQVAVCSKNLKDLESLLIREGERMKAAVEELSHLERVRRASVALNVWQPDVVRGSQKQIVEQCTVPIESRVSTLKMEVRVCKQQIAIYNKAYNDQKQKLRECKEALTSLKYHPLQSYNCGTTANDRSTKQKKLKRSSDSQISFSSREWSEDTSRIL